MTRLGDFKNKTHKNPLSRINVCRPLETLTVVRIFRYRDNISIRFGTILFCSSFLSEDVSAWNQSQGYFYVNSKNGGFDPFSVGKTFFQSFFSSVSLKKGFLSPLSYNLHKPPTIATIFKIKWFSFVGWREWWRHGWQGIFGKEIFHFIEFIQWWFLDILKIFIRKFLFKTFFFNIMTLHVTS